MTPAPSDRGPLVTGMAETITDVPIRDVLPADSPRLSGECHNHVELLAESGDDLPPIIVDRRSMRVIDGMHRLRAAVLRGESTIPVRFFDGAACDVFQLSVLLNVAHGLPLTLADRRAAAARILDAQPHLSDRAVARVVGLSPKTVTSVRQQSGSEQAVRVGRDGRLRPVSSAQGRRIASMIFAERPDASLREVARNAGISPATARDVRCRLGRDEDPVPPRLLEAEQAWRNGGPDAAEPDGAEHESRQRDTRRKVVETARRSRDPRLTLAGLCRDPSLKFTHSGRRLLIWLSRHVPCPSESSRLADTIPPHTTRVVAQLARQCAAEWIALANRLEDPHQDQGPELLPSGTEDANR
ncbi:MAG: hypothetical protein AVDCRST_MAG66-3786 [uncultured Pseudonocardia sp.]|uniref:ParB-like N-terminal domain-containing protein n=1 Tax=uncultured Pseudonocardia sp. TaxID=211455 RepID=A0A6J4QAB7_9PSEU|nr:MAG: hypothetical protein AVDCRST_MAG66-3786 [uncultured Pseudonocardia sp.]